MGSESFKDEPKTIGEIRSERNDDCKLWVPRDLLITLLREIDSGQSDITNMVVFYETSDERGRYIRAGDKPDRHLNMIELSKWCMIRDIIGK